MPIHVQAPNGEIVEFPDNTSNDVMENAMKQAYGQPAPKQADASEPGILGSVDAFGRGVAKMAGMGFLDELGAGADYAGSHIFPWRDAKTYDQALADTRGSDAAVAAAHPVADIAGGVAGAVGTGAALARNGLSLTSQAANAGRGLFATTAASAVDGGVAGAVQGFGQAQDGLDNRLKGATEGGEIGLAVGAALPLAISGATNAARRVISPFTSTPARQDLVNILGNEGVGVTAGQATGNNGLRYAESEIGGETARNIMDRQGEQFTSAVLRRAGATADRATPDVIDGNFRRIGQNFDDLAARNDLHPDVQLAHDLVGSVREYNSLVPPNARAPIVNNMVQDLGDALSQGPLNGAAYQAARSRLDRAARASANDPQLQDALFGIRNSLDDGMQRTLARTNPQDLGRWQRARREYRNMITIERAATGAGENAAQGIISPSSLRNATVNTQGRRAYARGQGDFADLARAGEGVMKPMPNSGTAGRFRAQNLGAGLTGIMGAVAGTHAGGPQLGLAAGAAGAMVPHALGRLMMTPTGQAYLRNQIASGNLTGPTRALFVSALNQVSAGEMPNLKGD